MAKINNVLSIFNPFLMTLKALTLSSLILISFYSCTNQINTTIEIKSIKPEKTGKVLVGKAVFPNDKKEQKEFTTKAKVFKEKNPSITINKKPNFKLKNNGGKIKKLPINVIKIKNDFRTKKRPFKTKAVFNNRYEEQKIIPSFNTKALPIDVLSVSTISVIIPSDSPNTPNKTIATGITDTLGNFQIDMGAITLSNNSIYVLEASKRTGKYIKTIRTYIKWNGTVWESMTIGDALINETTTSVSIIAGLTNISSINLISKIDPANIIDIKDSTNTTVLITKDDILKVSNLTNSVLLGEKDPLTLIKYDASKPYKFFVDQTYNYASLVTENRCKGCAFIGTDLLSSGISLVAKNLSYADLSGMDLSNKDFSNSILYRANLSNTILNGTNLSGADLRNANLKGSSINNPILFNTDFKNADFTDSTITNTDLSYSELRNTIFKNANFLNTNLEGADLREATLSNSKIDFVTSNFKYAVTDNVDFSNTDFSNKDFSYIIFNNIDFTNCNFTNVDFSNSSLIGNNFTGANLSNSNLYNSFLGDSIFSNTNISGTNFTFADLEFTDLSLQSFSGGDFSSALFYGKNMKNYDLSNANFVGTVFKGGSLKDANLTNSNLTNAVLYNTTTNGNYISPTPLIYESDTDGNHEIYSLDQDSNFNLRLTKSPDLYSYNGSVSPNGKKIMYIEQDLNNGNDDIYSVDSLGYNTAQLTNSLESEYEAIFSPDGTKIFYTSTINGIGQIFKMDSDGNNKINISNDLFNEYRNATISPNNKIAFYSYKTGFSQIYSSDLNGNNIINLSSNNTADDVIPLYSRDGKKIIFLSDRDTINTTGEFNLWIMDSDGSNKKKLLDENIINYFWSDDNKKILYTKQSSLGNYQISIINTVSNIITPLNTITNEFAIGWLHGKVSFDDTRSDGIIFYSDQSGNGFEVFSAVIDAP